MKPKIIILSVAAIALTIIGLSVASVLLTNQQNSSKNGYSEQQIREILTKVLENNQLSNIQATALPNSTESIASVADASSSLMLPLFPVADDFNGNNYKHSITKITTGAAASKCSGYYYDDNYSITEYYEYRPNNGADYRNFRYKSVTYNSQNNLTSYNLTPAQSEEESIYIDFAGGSYAVKNIYQLGPRYSIDVPSAVESGSTNSSSSSDVSIDEATSSVLSMDILKQVFGENASIIGEETISGVVHYLIKYEIDSNCPGTTDSLIYLNSVDSNTYQITKSSVYLGSVSNENLITSTISEVEFKSIDSTEADLAFNFGFNVPIKEVKYPYIPAEDYSIENEINKVVQTLKSENALLLYPLDSQYSLSYGYAYKDSYIPPEGSNYRADRNFYPSGALGDQLFDLYNPKTITSNVKILSTFNFTNISSEKDSLSIESVLKGVSKDEVINYLEQGFTQLSNKSISNGQAKINGTNTPITMLKFKARMDYSILRETNSSSSPISTRIAAPDAVDLSEERIYTYIIIESNSTVYILTKPAQAYENVTLNAGEVNLKTYNPNNSSDEEFLRASLNKAYTEPIPSDPGSSDGEGSSPGSGGSTAPVENPNEPRRPEGIACTMEAKLCPDGSYVGRNSAKNCEFDECPK